MSSTAPEHQPPADRFLTVAESAEYLSVSIGFVQKRIYDTKTLPAVRIDGSRAIRVRQSALDALLGPAVDE